MKQMTQIFLGSESPTLRISLVNVNKSAVFSKLFTYTKTSLMENFFCAVIFSQFVPKLLEKKASRVSRSSHRRCSVRKGVLRNFENSQEKTCARVFFFYRPEACNFIKKETLAQVLSCEFCEISKNTFFTEHLWAPASMFHIL